MKAKLREEFRLDTAISSDMFAVAAVFSASRDEALTFLPKLHTEEEDREYFSEVVFSENEVIVCRQTASLAIVGFIAFDDEFVHHLYLLPEYCHRGLGSMLIQEPLQRYDKIRLWVFQKNERARRFYERHGFLSIKFTDGRDNEEKQPDVLYEWRRNFGT